MLPPGGVFFGLIKYKSQFIRPTFLGQTNVKSFSIDLRKNELSMSTKRKISPGSPNSFHMIDLRPLGDSVYHYACRVVSSAFTGKNRVQQHQMVYNALGGRMGGELHALALQTSAPT